MPGVNFRIFPDGRRWGWQVLSGAGEPTTQGFARSRAEAAAYVIREAIRSVVPANAVILDKAA